jgi:F0F1-type ATP synthase assembly protein I
MAKPTEKPRAPRDADTGGLLATARSLQAGITGAGTVAAASYSLVGAIVVLGAGGYFADRWLGTSPWLLVTGLLLGIVVGLYEVARVVWRRTP